MPPRTDGGAGGNARHQSAWATVVRVSMRLMPSSHHPALPPRLGPTPPPGTLCSPQLCLGCRRVLPHLLGPLLQRPQRRREGRLLACKESWAGLGWAGSGVCVRAVWPASWLCSAARPAQRPPGRSQPRPPPACLPSLPCSDVVPCAPAPAGPPAVESLHQLPHPPRGNQRLAAQPGRQLERLHRPLAAPL